MGEYSRDYRSGWLFKHRSNQLLDYLLSQPKPYLGTQKDLAKALFIGERAITSYLNYLKKISKVIVQTRKHQIAVGRWINHRKIVVLNIENGK
jgi:hypothetical protein